MEVDQQSSPALSNHSSAMRSFSSSNGSGNRPPAEEAKVPYINNYRNNNQGPKPPQPPPQQLPQQLPQQAPA